MDPEDIHILITETLLLSSSGLPLEARHLRQSYNTSWAFKNPILFLTGYVSLSQLDGLRNSKINNIITNNRAQALTSPVKWIRDWAVEQSNMG